MNQNSSQGIGKMLEQSVITDGGIQANLPQLNGTQIVYLDFDGAETSYYNQNLNISIDHVVVEDSGFDSEDISYIVETLNAQFEDVVFTAELPQTEEYSTVYIGKTAAFDEYGSFPGLAENIDSGNLNHNDKAFVMLDSAAGAEAAVSVIEHETLHIVSGLDHGGQGLSQYAAAIYITTGQTSAYLTVGAGTSLGVLTGGYAGITTVNSGGVMTVAVGGSAYNVTVNQGGVLSVYSGAVVTLVRENGGFVSQPNGVTVGFTANTISGMSIGWDASVHGQTTAQDITVTSNGKLHVFYNGNANNTIVNDGGSLIVYAGGIASNTAVHAQGTMSLSSGAVLRGTTEVAGNLNAQGAVSASSSTLVFAVNERIAGDTFIVNDLSLISGASFAVTVALDQAAGTYKLAGGASSFANTITVKNTAGTQLGVLSVGGSFTDDGKTYSLANSSGNLTFGVAAAATGDQVKVYSSGNLVSAATVMTGKTLISGGYDSMYVSSGGTANSTTVYSGGSLYVYNGGTANSITVNSGGKLGVSSGGTVNNATILAGGQLGGFSWQEDRHWDFIADGSAIIADNVIVSGSSMCVWSGGEANSVTVNSSGYLEVSSGGEANSVTVNSSGYLRVINGGKANSVTVNSGGYLQLYSGGTVNSTTVNSLGYMSVASGGTATNIVASSGARFYIPVAPNTYIQGTSSGSVFEMKNAKISGYTVNSSCGMYVSSGGTADSTTVNASGRMHVYSGGKANSVTVNSSGYLYVSSGTANSATVNSGGELEVTSRGTVNNVTILAGGQLGGFSWQEDRHWDFIADGSAIIADNVIILGRSMCVRSGGQADVTTVNSRGWMYVSSGGTANSTTVTSFGYLYVLSGGTANSTTVNSLGYLYVSSGGIANDVTILAGGQLGGFSWQEDRHWDFIADGSAIIADNLIVMGRIMYVLSGGTANVTTVNNGGSLYVSSGGTANSTTVNSYCSLNVSSGGTANFTTVNSGGYLNVSSGGTANSTTVNSGGYLNVSNGGMARSATINSGGYQIISNGGMARSATINSGGHLIISNGGTATNIVASSGACLGIIVAPDTYIQGIYAGSVFEMKNAMIDGYTVNSGGRMYVSSGGSTNSTTVNSGGYLNVSSGGTANSTTVNSMGYLYVSRGGIANDVTILAGGQLGGFSWQEDRHWDFIADGSAIIADNVIISNNIYMFVSEGGTANATTVNSGGDLSVLSGGTANATTVNSVGNLYVRSGGVANATTVTYWGYLYVSSGGTANVTTVNSDGRMYVSSGGTANSTTVNSSGHLSVASGGTATNIVASSGAYFGIIVAPDTYIQGIYAGSVFEMKNAMIDGYTVNSRGSLYVGSGGTANATTVNSGGYLYVQNSGGVANATTVNNTGRLYVSSGGTANGADIRSGGILSAASESILRGSHSLGGTLTLAGPVNASGAVLDFAVNQRKTSDSRMINDLAQLSGASYTITVDADQAFGTYALAGGASAFNQTITVKNTGGSTLGSFVAGGTITAASREFTLVKNGDDLSLTIKLSDVTAPVIGSVSLAQGGTNYVFTASVSATDDKTAAGSLVYGIRYAASSSGLAGAAVRNGLSFTLTAADAGKTFHYQVSVTDEAGNTAWSEGRSFTVEDHTAPVLSGTPSAVYGDRKLTISWNVASDNVGVTGYRLTVNGTTHEVRGTSFVLDDPAAGTYTYRLSAVDGSGNESAASSQQTFTLEPRADLSIVSIKALKDGVPVTTVSTDDRITVYITLQNLGDVEASATTAQVYCGEVLLKEIAVAKIAKNSTAVCTCSVEAGSMSTGIQEIRVELDTKGSVTEYDESNNVKTLMLNVENRELCDLVIGSIGLDKQVYSPGEAAVVRFTVKNIGYTGSAATKATVYDGETLLGEVNVSALAAGSSSAELSYSIPGNTLSGGVHAIRVTVNESGEAYESNLDNNSATVQLTIGSSDLTVSKLSAAGTGWNTSEAVTLNFTIRNSGSETAAASTAGIYDGNTLLGTVDIAAVGGGLSVSSQYTIQAGKLSAGTHELRVVADIHNAVKESDETNNSRSLSLAVQQYDGTPPVISTVSAQQGGSDYTFRVTVQATDNVTPADKLAYGLRYAFSAAGLEGAEEQSELTFTLTATDAGRTVYYQVSAVDEAGNIAWSGVKSLAVKDVTKPELRVLSVSTQNMVLNLSWSGTDNVGISSYKVYFDDVLKSTQQTTTYTQSGITSGDHTYRIEAFDAAGNSASTGNVKLAFNDSEAPVISAFSLTQNGSTYDFTAAVTATDNVTPSNEIVSRIQYAFSSQAVSSAAVSDLTFRLTASDAGKTVYYRVSAADQAGNTAWSEIRSLAVKDVTAPGVPAGLVNTVNGTSVTLDWADASDNVGVAGYYVRYGTDSNLSGQGRSVNASQYSLSSLSAGVYYWQTAAYDAAGNVSEWSQKGTFRILPADPYENNDTPAAAYDLGTLSGEKTLSGGAVASASDVDWFKFTLDSKGTANDYIQITFDNRAGDLDLYLFSADGSRQLSASDSAGSNTETISLKDVSRGTYLVKAVGKNGAMNTYTLSAKKVAGYDPDVYDANSRNDTRAAATVFDVEKTPKNTVSGLNLHEAGDVDYYQFTLSNMGISGDRVSISFENSVGDLDLFLYDSQGTELSRSAGTGNSESISFSGLAAGTYYVQVKAPHNAVNEYTLDWNVTPNKVDPDEYEGREPVVISESTEITGLTISAAGAGVTQADTFTITLAAAGNSSSKIRFSGYRSDWEGLKYTVTDSSGQSRRTGIGTEISLDGLAAGDYTLTVDTPLAGSFGAYDITVSLPEADDPTWAVFVYMAADNNLETGALLDLLEMQKARMSPGIDVYVLCDRTSQYTVSGEYAVAGNWSDTRVGKIEYSAGSTITVSWESWGELNTGSSATLSRFLSWGAEQAPDADNYALVLWDHGGGIMGAMSDETSNHSEIQVYQIAEAVKQSDLNISVIGFDACLMGMAEVVSCFDGITDYLVASEETEWGEGWNWTSALESVRGDMSSEEFAVSLVNSGKDSPAIETLSAVATDLRLSQALEDFAAASAYFTATDWSYLAYSYVSRQNQNKHYYSVASYPLYVDLMDVLNSEILVQGRNYQSARFISEIGKLKETLSSVVAQNYTTSGFSWSSGVSIYSPCWLVDPTKLNGFVASTPLGTDTYITFLNKLFDEADQFFKSSSRSFSIRGESYEFINSNNEKTIVQSLGVFSGNGVFFDGLYSEGFDLVTNYFLAMTRKGNDGDKLLFSIANPDASYTISLSDVAGNSIYSVTDSGAKAVAVSLKDLEAGQDYLISFASNVQTDYTLAFSANWTTGVDLYDYALSGRNEKMANGNAVLEKATVLDLGYYSGLVTYAQDADWYKVNNNYLRQIAVEITGTGLTVAEYDAGGNLVQSAKYSGGKYTMTMKSQNYLYVEGNADISQDQVNAYTLEISNALTIPGLEPEDHPLHVVAGAFSGGASTAVLTHDPDGVLAIYDTATGTTQAVGSLDRSKWEIKGSGDYSGTGSPEVLMQNLETGDVYLVGNVAGGINEDAVTGSTRLGIVSGGYELAGVGNFNGSTHPGVLLTAPEQVSLGYSKVTGLACWALTDDFNMNPGWLGAMVTTWDGNDFRIDPADMSADDAVINAKYYSFELIGVGDFNGDGVDDVMIRNNMPKTAEGRNVTGSGDVFVFLTGSDISGYQDVNVAYTGCAADPWTLAGVGDLNGDGIQDAILLNTEDGGVASWLLDNTAKYVAAQGIGTLTDGQRIAGVGDVNGDGIDDILIADASDNLSAWTIKNGALSGQITLG